MLRIADAATILAVAILCCRSQIFSSAYDTFCSKSDNLKNRVDGSRSNLHTFRHTAPWLDLSDIFVKGHRATAMETHDVTFQVRQRNMDTLTENLHEISDPAHVNYGNHMTMEEINKISSNPDAHDEIIHYLKEAGATYLYEENGGQSISFRGPIALWERVFNTEFYSLENVADNTSSDGYVRESKKFIRSEKYSLPKGLDAHVAHVSNTIDVPTEFLSPHRISTTQSPKDTRMKEQEGGVLMYPYMTPEKINQVYNIDDNTGHPRATQAAFEGWGQKYSPEDLATFQRVMRLPIRPLNYSDPLHESTAAECKANGEFCAEGNIDYQYMTSLSFSPTIHYYREEMRFTEWITKMTYSTKVPLVISISYGSEESFYDISEMIEFDVGAIKLGLRGITLIVSSGDDGAAPRNARWDASKCKYMAQFPSSSAYVTSIGGSQGLATGQPETVCQNDNGGGITSGGGFSTRNNIPTYQFNALESYFAQVDNGVINAPYPGFGTGRGTPDVSLTTTTHVFIMGGDMVGGGGTSVSCPVMGAMVSLVNAARFRGGGKSLGWLNPALYAYADIFMNDIVSGNNRVTAGGAVCKEGFFAGPGWDPASGLGSINFKKSKIQMLKVANITYTGPSNTPTSRPSGPSRSPMAALTRKPTTQPSTRAPSLSPLVATQSPSMKPSATPSARSSAMPTLRPTPSPSSKPSAAPSPSRQPTPSPSVTPSALPLTPINRLSSRYPSAMVTATPSAPIDAPSSLTIFSPSASPITAVSTLKPAAAIVPNQLVQFPTIAPSAANDDTYYYYYDYVKPTAKPTRRPNRFRQPSVQPSQPPR